MPHSQPAGYLATPSNGNGRGVLVLHAWWGLNGTAKGFCDRLADSGFVAFAPDLYRGKVTDSIDEAGVLSDALDAARARADIARAVTYLLDQVAPDHRTLAVVGFSLGAFFAIELSTTDPDHIGSVVVYYGTGHGDFGKSRAAYLGHFAESDTFEPKEDVDRLEATLSGAGRPVTFHRYSGTGHWFAEADRTDAYDPAAADLAWERTLHFL